MYVNIHNLKGKSINGNNLYLPNKSKGFVKLNRLKNSSRRLWLLPKTQFLVETLVHEVTLPDIFVVLTQ